MYTCWNNVLMSILYLRQHIQTSPSNGNKPTHFKLVPQPQLFKTSPSNGNKLTHFKMVHQPQLFKTFRCSDSMSGKKFACWVRFEGQSNGLH